MQKLFLVFLIVAFGILLIACQNGVNPAETADQTGNQSLASLGKALPEGESELACVPGPPCATPGYWKNHPDAWPVDEITVGGVTYTKEEAIKLLSKPVRADKSITMFKALVAAKLNVLVGCETSCIADVIVAADEWMAEYGFGVKASSDAWQGKKCEDGGEDLYWALDDWNNYGC